MKTFLFYILLAGCFFISINSGCTKNKLSPVFQLPLPVKKYDTITSLAFYKYDTAIWIHDFKITMVTHVPDQTVSPCAEAFTGYLRSEAKTSFSTAAYETFNNINFLKANLPTENYMQSLGISATTPRVSDENRNCNISNCYLYAIARESDNDYHLIIGDINNIANNLLNCEASGNPALNQSSYSAINAIRNYLKGYFGTDFCGHSGYTKFNPALRVSVLKGSLFFDNDHFAGTVGPYGLRSNTSWEIHPIHNITF